MKDALACLLIFGGYAAVVAIIVYFGRDIE